MTPQPCKHCRFDGFCSSAGLVNRLAVEFWLADQSFECAGYQEDFYHGLEGVYA